MTLKKTKTITKKILKQSPNIIYVEQKDEIMLKIY